MINIERVPEWSPYSRDVIYKNILYIDKLVCKIICPECNKTREIQTKTVLASNREGKFTGMCDRCSRKYSRKAINYPFPSLVNWEFKNSPEYINRWAEYIKGLDERVNNAYKTCEMFWKKKAKANVSCIRISCGLCHKYREVEYADVLRSVNKKRFTGLCIRCSHKLKNNHPIRNIQPNGYATISPLSIASEDIEVLGANYVSGRSIYEHRYVMAKYLGRSLESYEEVHHINGDKADNRIENLELWSTSQPAGQRIEDKVEWAINLLKLYAPNELRAEHIDSPHNPLTLDQVAQF